MRWPLTFKSTCEAKLLAMSYLNQSLRDTISVIQQLLAEKNEQILALEAVLTSKSVIDYTLDPPKSEKVVVPVPPGRSAWRTRAKLRSKASIPPIADSVEALKHKVKSEGGKV